MRVVRRKLPEHAIILHRAHARVSCAQLSSRPSDPHAVLGISRGASKAEIREAYLAVSKRHHPDLNPGDSNATLRFQEVQRAWELLKNGAVPSSSGERRRSDPFAPRARAAAPPDERHFDYATWRAWHYGDNATATDSVRQASGTRTRHQSFFAKREASASGSNGRTTHRQLRKDRDGIASRLYERQRARREAHRTPQGDACVVS